MKDLGDLARNFEQRQMNKQPSVEYVSGETYVVLRGTKSRYGSWDLRVDSVRKTKPAVESNEVAMLLKFKLPVALFDKPLLSAQINVEAEVPMMELTPETVSDLQNLIRSSMGLDVQLTVIRPE